MPTWEWQAARPAGRVRLVWMRSCVRRRSSPATCRRRHPRGLDLNVARASSWRSWGPNGAGKSTLIKCLCGLMRPRQGRVLLDDVDITGHAPHDVARRRVGYVPQRDNVFPRMHGRGEPRARRDAVPGSRLRARAGARVRAVSAAGGTPPPGRRRPVGRRAPDARPRAGGDRATSRAAARRALGGRGSGDGRGPLGADRAGPRRGCDDPDGRAERAPRA